MASNLPARNNKTETAAIPYDTQLWCEYAQVYDEVLNVLPYRNLLLEVVDEAQIKTGMRVFDGCCGTGNLLWALNERRIEADVTEIDYSVDMLKFAKQKDYAGKANFVRANLDDSVESWGVPGGFDRLILNNCLSFLSDPTGVLVRAAQIAAPGAILVASTPRPNPNITELLEEHLELSRYLGISREEALQRMMPKLQTVLSCNERLLKRYGDAYHLPNLPQLRRWFEDAGWMIDSTSTTYAGQNWLVCATKKSPS